MSDLSLYQLTAQRLELQNKLMAMEFDEVTIADTLEGESSALEAKIEDYGWVIKNMEAFGDAIKAEEKRLADRRKLHDTKVERVKDWLLQNMEVCKISKIECPAFTISLKANPPKVMIDDEKAIPGQFLVVPDLPPPSPDKKAIAAELKAGREVAGCHLAQSKRIEIK
jgi:hypothetical protein